MKKNSILFCIVLMLALCLTACGQTGEKSERNGKINIVCTMFPEYDFARQIAGDQANVSMLLSPGTESHSYDPTPQDMIKIQDCDVFIYGGGESDQWVKKVFESADTKEIKEIKIMNCVKAVEEETVEGMEKEEEHDDGDQEDVEYDEHVWTSPKNAKDIVKQISKTLCQVDPDHKSTYQDNSEAYLKQLDELDQQFQKAVDQGKRKTIIFGDRFPFRYLADAYGLTYYAAFPGCSTETEPSAATVSFLIDKVNKDKIPVVFHVELSNEKMADSICEATGAKKMLLHACHNIAKDDFEKGVTYLDLMRQNVKALKEALQ